MKQLLSCIVLFLLLLSISLTASATEIPDWSTVDWETVKISALFKDAEVYQSLISWLEKDAPFSELFEYGKYTDGAYTTSFISCATKRFITTPEEFLVALAKEDEFTQERIILGLSYDIFHDIWINKESTAIQTIEGICLSNGQNPKAVELMRKLIESIEKRATEQKVDISITAPQTGDPVMGAVAALVLSGSALVLLRKKPSPLGRVPNGSVAGEVLTSSVKNQRFLPASPKGKSLRRGLGWHFPH